jgi:hypothetical protein
MNDWLQSCGRLQSTIYQIPTTDIGTACGDLLFVFRQWKLILGSGNMFSKQVTAYFADLQSLTNRVWTTAYDYNDRKYGCCKILGILTHKNCEKRNCHLQRGNDIRKLTISESRKINSNLTDNKMSCILTQYRWFCVKCLTNYSETCLKWNMDKRESCLKQKTFTVPRILCEEHYKTTCNKHKLTKKWKARTRLDLQIFYMCLINFFPCCTSSMTVPFHCLLLSAVWDSVRKCS